MKKRIPAYTLLIGVVLALALGVGGTLGVITLAQQGSGNRRQLAVLERVLSVFDSYSVLDAPSDTELTGALAQAVIEAYGDRYAAYFPPDEYEEYSDSLAGNYVGIGITARSSGDGGIQVLLVHEGSSADEAGLLAGDIIVAVDGVPVAEMGYDEAMNRVVGEAGTFVSLTWERDGRQMDGRVERRQMTKQTVVYRMCETDRAVGYVRILSFDGGTYEQFTRAIETLEAAGAQAFVFDVRDNGGGTLLSVSQMLAYLLPDGDLVYVEGVGAGQSYTISARDGTVHYNRSDYPYYEGGHVLDAPMAVLVNGNTASAAELFCSALRDYAAQGLCDAVVVGENTYGKGTAQTTFPVTGGGYLKLTVAYYNPPCNINYDGVGIAPEIEASLSDEALQIGLYLLPEQQDQVLCAAIAALQS